MNTANLSFGFILQAVPCPESPKDMQILCFQMTRRLIFRFHEMNPWHSHLILFHSLAQDRFTAPNLNFYSFARASKFKRGVQNHPLCFTEIDQTQDQNVPNISRSVYVGLNCCQKFHLRVVMAIKICLGVEIKIKIAPQRWEGFLGWPFERQPWALASGIHQLWWKGCSQKLATKGEHLLHRVQQIKSHTASQRFKRLWFKQRQCPLVNIWIETISCSVFWKR